MTKHSWLRESVDRVLSSAPHLSNAHKRKLVEAVGLELARAHARGGREFARACGMLFAANLGKDVEQSGIDTKPERLFEDIDSDSLHRTRKK